MERDDLGLTSYYHHHHHPQPQRHPHKQPSPTVTNGMLQTTTNEPRPSQLLYPRNSAPSAVSSPLETGVRRKRGRPRKYGTPEQAAAAKRLSSSSTSTSVPALGNKKELSLGVSGSSSPSFKKSSLGNTGQGFTPHIISVAAGEDISQKIVSFMQQRKQEMCVLSASGLISNACLSQPVSSGGNITYEGRFNIISLCGSYVRTEFGGSTGGLSVCLSSNDGQIIGGTIHGPLIAAGPVQVIVGTFNIEGKKENAAVKVDVSSNKLPSPSVGPSVPNLSFLSGTDSSGRNVVGANDEQQNIDLGYQFMIQNRNLPVSEWRNNNNESRNTSGFDFSGMLSGAFGHDL
ncbi:AT-hook motif nuclear-localized protein 14-like [Bidens hawaiensis]|uniref:AT-hook motif nuclear-localized protein 14-like n=1 Tax=Bidens hawaiensis TaxID=980011 RepID=UPI00404B70EF